MSAGVAGVLLAAGGGRRFGRPKALVVLGGRTLVERGVATLLGGGCSSVLVVVGAAAADVRSVAVRAGAVPVANDAWADGLGAPLPVGPVPAAQTMAGVAVVLPADQPIVTPALVARLIGAWQAGAMVAVAAYGGMGRTPVVLDRATWPAATAAAEGDVGARPFIRAHPELVVPVPCDDVGAGFDIDTEDDLWAAEEQWGEWLASGEGDLPEPVEATAASAGDPVGAVADRAINPVRQPVVRPPA